MDTIVSRAEVALRDHPHPALRIFELLELIAAEVDRSLTPERLRTILEGHPERFRVLDASCMRWGVDDATGRQGAGHAWVVVVSDDGTPPEGPPSIVRLRESVRWLGREIDARSNLDLSRWHAIVLAERDARAAMLRKVA